MNKTKQPDDCSRHQKDLFGETDMKKVAEAIGDLHYEAAAKLYKELTKKYKADSRNDWQLKKIQLASRLASASLHTKSLYIEINEAWQISKPHMKEEKK